jgi:hypothetical protein
VRYGMRWYWDRHGFLLLRSWVLCSSFPTGDTRIHARRDVLPGFHVCRGLAADLFYAFTTN